MVVLAVLLAVATARGDVAEAEAGEDIDLTSPPDWLTVGKLVGILVLNLLLVNLLGLGDHRRPALRRLRVGARAAARCCATCSSAPCSRWAAGTSSTSGSASRSRPGILDGIL